MVFGDEIMVAEATVESRLTQMTLAMAKDSGWYEVDLDLGEHFFWGKGEGCSIFENKCDPLTNNEFCAVISRKGCDDTHTYLTKCAYSQFADSCGLNVNMTSCKRFHETEGPQYYGPEAKCMGGKVGCLCLLIKDARVRPNSVQNRLF